jgi:phospholipid/cholesterol/gamma-HCH transport system substrate-binding protein
MKRSAIETVLGAVVLLVAAVFMVLAYNTTDLKPKSGYELIGKFYAVDGLSVGSDVRIGGVKVGAVIDQYIDPELYQAVVKISVQDAIKVPEDSTASVSSSGLLGGKYLKIDPGNSSTLLTAGGEIKQTKDVVALEELLGKVIFLVTDQDINQ